MNSSQMRHIIATLLEVLKYPTAPSAGKSSQEVLEQCRPYVGAHD